MRTPEDTRSGVTACVFCNGEIRDMEGARDVASGAGLLIAADGGARYLAAMGLIPHAVIGDMDSIDGKLPGGEEGAEVIAFPRDKDQSDAELAVRWAVKQGAGHILLLGAWGGRPDHAIGNAALLTRFPGILEIRDDGYLILALGAGQRLEVLTFPGAVVSMFSGTSELLSVTSVGASLTGRTVINTVAAAVAPCISITR